MPGVDKGLKLVATVDTTPVRTEINEVHSLMWNARKDVRDATEEVKLNNENLERFRSGLKDLKNEVEVLDGVIVERKMNIEMYQRKIDDVLSKHQIQYIDLERGINVTMANVRQSQDVIRESEEEIQRNLESGERLRLDIKAVEVNIAQVEARIEKSERDLMKAQFKAAFSFSRVNNMAQTYMHIAERMMDKTTDGWVRTIGMMVSGISSTVASMNALAESMMFTGPAGMLQGMLMMAANQTSLVMSAAAMQQAQALKKQSDYDAELEASNKPW